MATKNIPYSLIYPITQTIVPKDTVLGAGIKATTGKSFAGTETSFQKQSDFNAIKLNENNVALEPYIVAFDSAETAELGSGVKSFDMRMFLASNDSNVSPMIDLQRTSITLVDNLIDKHI